MTLDDLDLI